MWTLEQAIEDTERACKESRNRLQYALKRGETKFAERCKKDAEEFGQLTEWLRELVELRKAPKVVFCKDCAKHNVDMRDSLYIEKAQECPLIHYRGKAQGHEFDYQYCAFAERRIE